MDHQRIFPPAVCAAILVMSALLLWGCAAWRESAGNSSTLFVATNGNDAWSGLLPLPNRRRTDGPFATLARALQPSRKSRQTNGSFTIRFRPGSFFRPEPLVFPPADS